MSLKLMFSAASILLLSQASFAHEGFDRPDGPGGGGPEFHHPHIDPIFFQAVMIDGKGPKEGPCSEIKLDKAQKSLVKEAYFKFKDAQIDLESALKKAELNREKVQFDDKATFQQADDASKAKLEALVKVMAAHDSFRNEIEFKILKPEQRGPARMCEMMHRHHEGARGPAGMRKWHKRGQGKDSDKK